MAMSAPATMAMLAIVGPQAWDRVWDCQPSRTPKSLNEQASHAPVWCLCPATYQHKAGGTDHRRATILSAWEGHRPGSNDRPSSM
jgi:hypothetical protein